MRKMRIRPARRGTLKPTDAPFDWGRTAVWSGPFNGPAAEALPDADAELLEFAAIVGTMTRQQRPAGPVVVRQPGQQW